MVGDSRQRCRKFKLFALTSLDRRFVFCEVVWSTMLFSFTTLLTICQSSHKVGGIEPSYGL
jgi:hypothetical protein